VLERVRVDHFEQDPFVAGQPLPRWTAENRQFLDRQNRQFPAAETG
jgi:hypothetical protein